MRLALEWPTNVGNAKNRKVSEVFQALPRGLGALIQTEFPSLTKEITHRVMEAIPEYSDTADAQSGQTVKLCVEQGLAQFTEQITHPALPQEIRANIFRAIGRLEAQRGHSIDSIQAAFRLVARLAWRYIIEFGQRSELAPSMMWLIGDAALVHLDRLVTLMAEGYAEVSPSTTETVSHHRRMLLNMVVAKSPPARRKLDETASQSNWRLPSQVCAVVLLKPASADHNVVPQLPDQFLADLNGTRPILIVPEPNGWSWTDALAQRVPTWPAVVGPTVRLSEAGKSLRQALDLAMLVTDGHLERKPVMWCSEHLYTLWLLNDDLLARQLIHSRLTPLLPLPDKQQLRLRSTLLAWIEQGGSAPKVARQLGVHPQTVRYRLRQLEKLFGTQLTDPRSRFEMELALRVTQLRDHGADAPTSTAPPSVP